METLILRAWNQDFFAVFRQCLGFSWDATLECHAAASRVGYLDTKGFDSHVEQIPSSDAKFYPWNFLSRVAHLNGRKCELREKAKEKTKRESSRCNEGIPDATCSSCASTAFRLQREFQMQLLHDFPDNEWLKESSCVSIVVCQYES